MQPSKQRAIKSNKLVVDIVADDGKKWIKVISKSAKKLNEEISGADGSKGRSLKEKASDYITMSQYFPVLFRDPEIVFEFTRGLPSSLADELEQMGILVYGPEELINVSKLSMKDDCAVKSERKVSTQRETVEDILNLDITAIFVLISSLTQENGSNYSFKSALLTAQAKAERAKAALPEVLDVTKGKRLIMCKTAYDAFTSILKTVAGPNEKRRAEKLFEHIEIVDDMLSDRARKLEICGKVNKRSKIIFGSGDHYKAVTLTANSHFVNAAAYQGVRFNVILHQPRALSEQKQVEDVVSEV